MSTGKAERAGVTAVVDYLDKVDKFEPFISYSDKAPIIDGYFNIYNNGRQKVEDFYAQIPVQVKGTASDKDHYFRIGREHVDAYKQLGGIVFFKVILNSNPPTLLYAILTLERIEELLKQTTNTIKIELNVVPTKPEKFEKELFNFATNRNGEKVKNSTPWEIVKLVERFEKIREYLNKIEDKDVKIELELYLDSIKNLKADGTIGWRDKFILYSRKALFLVTNHLADYDFTVLHFKMGRYSYQQKLYHLAENYYQKALLGYNKREDKRNQASTLNNLAILHKVLTSYDEAEQEYQEALTIHRELAETNGANDFNVAKTLNNLAILHKVLTSYDEAEDEYLEALKIYSELAEENESAYNANVATTLNNLGDLYRALNRYDEAGQKYKEALVIRRKLAEENESAYIANVATTLNNMGDLYRALNLYEEAEQKYKEALVIRRKLAEENESAYIANVATTLNSMGELHRALNLYGEAEREYSEALIIRRDLVMKNRDVYLKDLAEILYNFSSFRKDEKRLDEARVAANDALDIYMVLANKYPQIWNKDVEKTQRLLDELESS